MPKLLSGAVGLVVAAHREEADAGVEKRLGGGGTSGDAGVAAVVGQVADLDDELDALALMNCWLIWLMIEADTVFGFVPAGSSAQVHCVSPMTPNDHALAVGLRCS